MAEPNQGGQQLRVLAFCDYLSMPLSGGAERVTSEIFGRVASNSDVSISVVSGVSGRRPVKAPINGVEVTLCRGFDLSRLLGGQMVLAPGLPFASLRAFRRVRPDVIHASSIHFFGTIVAACLAFVTRVPLVITCHVSSIDALPRRTRMLARAYEATVGRLVLGRARRVIAVSNDVGGHVTHLGVPGHKVDVIENGVDAERFVPGDRPGSPVHVAVVGRLIANKGPMQVIEALASVTADVRLTVAGEGPLRDAVAEACADDDRLGYIGHVGDVAGLLEDVDIFIRMSTTEGRSLAVLEAMSAGCAVIVSDISANTELVEHDVSGMVVPLHDRSALAACIDELAGDSALRERLGRAARQEAMSWSWDAAADRTRKVLASVVDG